MENSFMARAIELSLNNVRDGGGPFGSVVVKAGSIIGEGANQVTVTNDPTAHAEMLAIRRACANSNSFDLQGCEIYTSCEPCPMCLAAIYWARLASVYFANSATDAAAAGFDDALIYRELALPPHRRKMPMTQMSREQALPAFTAWKNNPNKTAY
jgi:guanine deaminase